MDILNNASISYDCVRASVAATEQEISDFEVEYGDVLFQRSSETLEDIGRSNIYVDSRHCVFGGFVIRGKKIGEYEPYFMKYRLDSPYARKSIIVKGAGAQHFNIGQDGLSKVELFFPKYEEQVKIGDLLRIIDDRINTQSKIIEEQETLLRSLRHKLFNQCLDSHTQCRIGDILSIGSGKDYQHLREGEIPVYGTGGLISHVNESLYDGESVCIGRKGTINKPLYLSGRFWTVDTLFYTHSFNGILPRFCYHLFCTIDWLTYNEASGVPSLSKSTIEKILVSIPQIDIQKRIVQILDSIEEKINIDRNTLLDYQKQKIYLLSRMFI